MPQQTSPANSRRILVIRNAFTYDFGGGERFPVDLATELVTHGYQPTIVSRSPKLLDYAQSCNLPTVRGWWWQQQNWSGSRLILLPAYLIWQGLLTIWYLRLIARLQPQVIHAQSKDDFIAATIAGKLRGKRVIWTDHADLKYVYANYTVWYKNPVGKLVAWASRYADAITLVSYSEEQLIKTALGVQALPARYSVIHNGVRDQKIAPATPPGADDNDFIYCTTSRLVTAKGIGELLEAFRQLQATHSAVRLWLVGDGPEIKKFKAMAGDNPAIAFLGHVDKPLPLVAGANVFVHPSYHEGFSLSLVEAAMLGKPIIACNVGGNPEIVHDMITGLLIPTQNSQALYEAMLKLYADRPLALKLGSAARASYQKLFQFDQLVSKNFIPLYESVKS